MRFVNTLNIQRLWTFDFHLARLDHDMISIWIDYYLTEFLQTRGSNFPRKRNSTRLDSRPDHPLGKKRGYERAITWASKSQDEETSRGIIFCLSKWTPGRRAGNVKIICLNSNSFSFQTSIALNFVQWQPCNAWRYFLLLLSFFS